MANPISPDDAAQTPRILIIDDNPNIHEAFSGILQTQVTNTALEADEALLYGPGETASITKPAYQLDHALSGLEGVEKVQAAVTGGNAYQLAFVDIRMPGIDGVETIERMWRVDARIQTVICTAYADHRWEDLARRLGQTDRLLILKKPFHDVEVMQLASTLTRKWFLDRQAALQLEQLEGFVAQRTQRLLELHRQEHERVHQLDETKLRFLRQLAQRFRDPLTIILNALESGAGPVDAAKAGSLRRNVEQLRQLVEDSLQLRELDPEDMQLRLERKNPVGLIRGVVEMFASRAREKQVKLTCAAEEQPLLWLDAAKLEKILVMVLTPLLQPAVSGGSIVIRPDFRPETWGLAVEFSGNRGMAEVVARVFKEGEPTGLLLRQLLGILGGEMVLPLTGATSGRIVFTLPVNHPPAGALPAAPAADGNKPATGMAAEAMSLEEDREQPLLLLVESNQELKEFLREGLGPEFRILEPDQAEQALAVAGDQVPDLVILGSAGTPEAATELCRKLKADRMTSHIPIILFTADDSETAQLKALEVGVDDYLTKPFRMPLFKARVENLLQSRRRWHEHFQGDATLQPRELALNRVDADFLQRVEEIVTKNLADYEFDIDQLAQQMAVSRRQLFRKFKALAGCTPNVFVREIRLKRAAELLKNSPLTVSEIIYAVGFSDPKYFRAVFKERFGVLPGEYPKQG
ncbi:MAG TPA: response regulator [Dongiaceae bacterium]|nr:response regulator [Dongiaceae bacterium]